MDGQTSAVVSSPRSHELVSRCIVALPRRFNQLLLLPARQSQQVIGRHPKKSLPTRTSYWNSLVFHHSCDGNYVWRDERGGRDGIVARPEVGHSLDKDGKGDHPPLSSRADNFQKLSYVIEPTFGLGMELVLVTTQLCHLCLEIDIWCKGSNASYKLTSDGTADLKVVARNGVECGWGMGTGACSSRRRIPCEQPCASWSPNKEYEENDQFLG